MPRLHLFEIHDQDWCPASLRDGATDFLQFLAHIANSYGPVAHRLRSALEQAGARRIVDLCAGAGGPWLKLQSSVTSVDGSPTPVLLTDLFPNLEAMERMRVRSGGLVDFHTTPVDATETPDELEGFRTLFASFHHFKPQEARKILADAVRHGQGVGVFEMTHRSLVAVGVMGLAPLLVLVCAPFVRPFRWSRLLWTYPVPILPLLALFDGVVSCLRTYSPAELEALTEGLDEGGYVWEFGEEHSGPGPVPVTYLIGHPAR